jgi:ERCC4-type nuclease
MRLIIDTREKKCEHIKKWFDEHGIDYIVRKLDEGDYQIEGCPGVTVDRKQNLSELSRNLMNKTDHSRFWREVRRAKERKEKLFVLVEHGCGVKSIEDVASWRDQYSGVSGRMLVDEISRVSVSYGVNFVFCDKRSTAKKIIEILMDNIYEQEQLFCDTN